MISLNSATRPHESQQEHPARETEERHRFLSLFLSDVVSGLEGRQKSLPCKYFYDSTGSHLFDRICELPEYYPTRTEIGILQQNISEITEAIGSNVQVVEYGSGSGLKTRLLLQSLQRPTGCALVEISEGHLKACAQTMQREFPTLKISAVCADYTRRVSLPKAPAGTSRKVVFFPGSTIGNFDPGQAEKFLRAMGESVGKSGALLIGVDLQKSRKILEPAYDDSSGVTAEFNLNILRRINRDLGVNFRLEQFQHRAPYNAALGRVEMHLQSISRQHVRIGDRTFKFDEGETIHTENSYKYTLGAFKQLAARAGWQVERIWTDDRKLFSVQFLTLSGK